jgi:hypothetical protein
MKKMLLAIIVCGILFPMSVFAAGVAGTCTGTVAKCQDYNEGCYIVTESCTAGTGDYSGIITNVSIDAVNTVSGTVKAGYVYEIYTVPGTISDSFTATIKTGAGLTVATDTDCDSTVNTELFPNQYKVLTDAWTITAADCGSGGTFTLIMKFVK